jgi:transcriptional/translational regulatory protein YebC/TACO1
MLKDMMDGKYVWGPISLEEAIKKAKSYKISDSTIEKAISLI